MKLLIVPLLAASGATILTISFNSDAFFALTSIQSICFSWFIFMNVIALMCMLNYLTDD